MSKRRESEIFDNGRRGEPLNSCDCITCFGYCITNKSLIQRELPDDEGEHGDGRAGEEDSST